MSELTRRQFLVGTAAVAGASVVGVAGPAFGRAAVDPATTKRNRLVVIFLEGGNDGLNYVVPRGDVAGAPRLSVYRRVRPTIGYAPGRLLPLDRGADAAQLLGFNPTLTHLHDWYRAGRVAIVQGVDYPNHNYSHFTSQDIWHAGNTGSFTTGWLGRHLDRAGVGEGELRGVAVSSKLPLMLQGRGVSGASIASIDAMRFRDGTSAWANTKHAGLASLGAASRPGDPLRQRVAATLHQAVDVVTDLSKTEAPPANASPIAESLLTARALLEQNLGVECVYVSYTGFDTHTTQVGTHEKLLGDLDSALDAFWAGLPPAIGDRTLVMLVSEFGRRIGEAGRGARIAGTDHGAAAPVTLIGPPQSALVPGLHGDHPNMGTPTAPADNLAMTTDVRHVYQAVLQSWLHSPDPLYNDAESGPLRGLFDEPKSASGPRARIGSAARLDKSDASTSTSASVLGRGAARSRGTLRVAGGAASGGAGRSVPLSSAAAALAFNAFVAAIVVRSGRFREALATWRDDNSAL